MNESEDDLTDIKNKADKQQPENEHMRVLYVSNRARDAAQNGS